MPSKYQEYRQMADTAERQLTSSYKRWTQFLRTAARLYKYPYNEQVMIHAQRPDATACAEYDFWNKKMGRFIRRGSTGIALIDTSGQKPQLRYVFDVADTGEREHSRPVHLWQFRAEHEDAVIDTIQVYAQYAVSIDRLLQTRREQRQLDRKQAQRRLQTLQSRKAQLDERLQDLYERLVEGEISRESFAAQKKVLTAQTEEITCTVLELERKISGSDDNSNAVIEQFKSYAGITALTKEISADLLQSVTIYPDGRMDIRLNLADEIKALMETLHREFCTA